ncbi:MAG: HU family DNA-binding protein [Deltaproteobacteria bacterium]|nr:HU family DNA-binding protein [Deltaproteobacteria bacterium]
MTKAELVSNVAKDCRCSKALAEKTVNATTNQIAKCLRKNDKITLTGFGTFYPAKRKGRIGRNPQTGAQITIQPRRVPRFKAGKQLKDWVK